MENIICPGCGKYISSQDKWDFMDGEIHQIICTKCKKKFNVRIERPIEYYITN